jgi:hypothetical protein
MPLQDIALVLILAGGNDYLPRTLATSNLDHLIEQYKRMRRCKRWSNRCLVVHDAVRRCVAFDAEFLLHFLLNLPADADQVMLGKAINAVRGTTSQTPLGAKHGTTENQSKAQKLNVLGRWKKYVLPDDISLGSLATHVTDPRVLALLDWAAGNKLCSTEVEALLQHVLKDYQVCSLLSSCCSASLLTLAEIMWIARVTDTAYGQLHSDLFAGLGSSSFCLNPSFYEEVYNFVSLFVNDTRRWPYPWSQSCVPNSV